MAIIPTQKFRFLGGEVSPNVYHSADMEQYGRWFSNAENIRFETLGAFKNRPGFAKIALSKASNGTPIKLLPFSFSKEENYLIEMGTGYFRFFQNGEPIYNNGDSTQGAYEVEHDMQVTEADIKYVQVGDIIYLANGKNPVGMLTRNDSTGYNWTFGHMQYKDSCPPLDEANTDTYKTLTLSNASASLYASFYTTFNLLGGLRYIKNVTIDIEDTAHAHHQFSSQADKFYSLPELADYFNTTGMSSSYNLVCSAGDFGIDNTFTIAQAGATPTILSAKIVTATYFDRASTYYISYREGDSVSAPDETASNFSTDGAYLYEVNFMRRASEGGGLRSHQINYQYFIEGTHAYSLSYAASLFSVSYNNSYSGLTVSPNPQIAGESYLVKTGPWYLNTEAIFAKLTTITNRSMIETTMPVSSSAYTITPVGHNFFANKSIGDVFAINRTFEPQQITFYAGDAGMSAVGATSDILRTNGKWGVVSTGSWEGEFVLEYSLDGSNNWKTFYTCKSDNKKLPQNINTSGSLQVDQDIVYIRLRVTSALSELVDGSDHYYLDVTMFGDRVNVWSYYQIVSIDTSADPYTAICLCVKNNISLAQNETVTGLYTWRESFFSDANGWPEVVSIYQNRLILAKDYILTASRINSYDDFYEATAVAADDPIIMSLLSNKYNRVRNILTIREFFVFTENGEFGISSQLALTQTDKTLKPLSYHGSNECEPVLAGNLALFVDSTGNTVRLFKYSYETDAYEANDASVFLEQLLRDRSIISSAYIRNSKEALFLDDSGTIWVFKLMPEQEVYAWSHLKYAAGHKITNICVVQEGYKEILYIAVEDRYLGEKRIERLTEDMYWDSEKVYTSETATKDWTTDFPEGTVIIVEANNKKFKCIVQESGAVSIQDAVTTISCHYSYTSTATLLSPTAKLTEDVHTTYNKGKPFKVYFAYQDSYGFKVGVEEGEKMLLRFNSWDEEDAVGIKCGKKEVLIPSRYDGSSRVSFVQERPYKMSINNILIDMDYGGK